LVNFTKHNKEHTGEGGNDLLVFLRIFWPIILKMRQYLEFGVTILR